MLSVQEMITALQAFWLKQGCSLHLGHDVETGAGTFNPATFFRCLGPEPYRAAYAELSRRPKDGRYGENPNRMQLFHQYQVILKPSPPNVQELYLQSLESLGFELEQHDIRFVQDDWEQPTLGAWGLGWEVWRDGMEISQFTYFQAVGGQELHPITVELTYGLERIAMTVQRVDRVWDLKWNAQLTYADLFHQNEVEWSTYNFEHADVELWRRHYSGYIQEAKALLDKDLPHPAYDFVIKASHAFNLLDARGVVSVTERTAIIAEIRDLARNVAESYLQGRKRLGYPLLKRNWPEPRAEATVLAPMPPAKQGKADFLFEIGCEELPASFVPIGAHSLQVQLEKLLTREGLPFDRMEVHSTPRRLAALVQGLSYVRPGETIEKRGPPRERAYDETGKLTRAGEGFMRSLGEPTPEIEMRAQKGVDYLFAKVEIEAEPAAHLLAKRLPELIEKIDFPKKMRWGTSSLTYARPIHWIVALHGDGVIPFELAGITSGSTTYGHRQLNPGPIQLLQASRYLEELRDHQVLASVEERKNAILEQLGKIEQETKGQALQLPQLLLESLNLVEWPQLTTATFDPNFLKAPPEVLISEMVEHQKYFPLADSKGGLIAQFVIVADNNLNEEIRHGNAKVLSARLSDGVFLYEQDLNVTLDRFNERLKAVTFRRELGSVRDKAERVRDSVEILYRFLPIGELSMATRAAILCKADLSSELVNEFPDLQGTVGRYYALAQGDDPAVATAIEEHWWPKGENGHLPTTPAGVLVSLADKIDNLISCFALDLKPTSSSDPYGLRRQVLGIVRTLIHGHHRLNIVEAIEKCYESFLASTGLAASDHLVEELVAFFTNRIKTVFMDYGLTKEETTASLSAGFSDIYDSFCRVQALHRFCKEDPRFPALVEVYKRAKGQFVGHKATPFSGKLLVEREEKELANALKTLRGQFDQAMGAHSYDQAYQLLASLQPQLALLFDHVRILAEDPKLRGNRLALLGQVFELFGRLLDFSQLRL